MPDRTRRLRQAGADLGGLAVGGVLAGIAAARRGKAVHPHGVVHRGRLVVAGDPAAPAASRLLSVPAEHDVLVRFSRSIGLPRPLPDLLGMSIRVVDAYGEGRHQDLLLITSIDLPVLHHVFVPAGDVGRRPYTSSLPYRAGDETFLIGAVPEKGDALRFGLAVARIAGRFRTVGRLDVGERLPDTLDALRFSPFNTGGGLAPSGLLNGMRALAYPMSQAAWGTTQGHGDEAQATADDLLDREFQTDRA